MTLRQMVVPSPDGNILTMTVGQFVSLVKVSVSAFLPFLGTVLDVFRRSLMASPMARTNFLVSRVLSRSLSIARLNASSCAVYSVNPISPLGYTIQKLLASTLSRRDTLLTIV